MKERLMREQSPPRAPKALPHSSILPFMRCWACFQREKPAGAENVVGNPGCKKNK